MATTTPNFGWSVPTSSDLVKNGAVAIETLGDSIDASLVDLKGGTTGQVLAKASNTDMDFTWEGAWTTYSPTYLNLTPGNGTVVARYRKIGKTVEVFYRITWGSTTSISNYPIVSFPVAPAYTTPSYYAGDCTFTDNGVAIYPGRCYLDTTNGLQFTLESTNGTWNAYGVANGTTPVTFATGDIWALQATYEAA